MIINSIRAENLLRYSSLSIDLAEQGLIAVSGQNESGKSSIGETVCFALFGRTFSIPPEDIGRVVKWGEPQCAVTLVFSVEDKQYVLSRYLDRDGSHSAKLVASDNPQEPLARGIQGVSDALFKLLGFEYGEFVESFYLAQREITTPHPHSHAIKIMAGVAPLEKVIHTLRDEIRERQDLLSEIRTEWDSVDKDLQQLGIHDGYLPQLEDTHHQMSGQLDQVDQLIDGVNTGMDTCTANTEEIHRLDGDRRRTSLLRFVVVLAAVAMAGLWVLLGFAAGLPLAEQARAALAEYVPRWNESRVMWIAYLAAGLGLLWLLLWGRIAGLRRRIQGLREEIVQLADVLGEVRKVDIETVDESGAGDAEAIVTRLSGQEEQAVSHRPNQGEFELIRGALEAGEVNPELAAEYCDRELAWLGGVKDRLRAELGDLGAEIDEEKARVQEASNLADVLNGLTDKKEEVEEHIEDRKYGLELLDGAIAYSSNKFNRDVRTLAGRLLPMFTDGRYEHLQIDDDLGVKVFSSDKRDFMNLDEISSGTQRQIMLALRLALSKQLLSRTVKGGQFVFLDEPFAFFDEERTCLAMQALANVGDNISQVWIVAQDFPENCDVRFDTTINCQRGKDTLEVAG